MGQEINELLMQIDFITEQTQELASARGPGGREVALTITKLQEARFWLAESIKTVNTPKKEHNP